MEPLRKQLIDTLGARCQQCGYDQYQEALTIEADRKHNEFPYRLRYLEYCTQNPDKCKVVCMNCKAHRMAEGRQDGTVRKPRKKLLVWPCPLPKALGVRYPWLDRKVEEGFDVAIYFGREDEVWWYKLPEYAMLAGSWVECQRVVGGPEKAPEGVIIIE